MHHTKLNLHAVRHCDSLFILEVWLVQNYICSAERRVYDVSRVLNFSTSSFFIRVLIFLIYHSVYIRMRIWLDLANERPIEPWVSRRVFDLLKILSVKTASFHSVKLCSSVGQMRHLGMLNYSWERVSSISWSSVCVSIHRVSSHSLEGHLSSDMIISASICRSRKTHAKCIM